MKGMIFDATSVQQILAGTKTQTRRIIKRQPLLTFSQSFWHMPDSHYDSIGFWPNGETPDPANPKAAHAFTQSRYKVGETIYLKESWTLNHEGHVLYLADWKEGGSQEGFEYRGAGWRSPLFMPERASRIKLTITNIRIEQTQAISMEDCIKEGVWSIHYTTDTSNWFRAWQRRWIDVNDQHSWDRNPWVWVYEFVRV